MDQGGLERVVVRVGVGNEGFVGAGSKTLNRRAGVGVGRGVLGDHELGTTLRGHGERVLSAHQRGEIAIAGFA